MTTTPGVAPKCTKGALMAGAASKSSTVYMFGGFGSRDAVVWGLGQSQWRAWTGARIVKDEPEPRWKGAFCRVNDKTLVLFGGSADVESYFDDTWFWRQNESEWERVKVDGPKPSARRAHTGVVAGEKQFVIFGGKEGKTKAVLKDLWAMNLDGPTYEWVRSKHEFPGEPRKGHTSVMVDGKMIVYGGRENNLDYFGDLFVLNFDAQYQPSGWTEIKPNGKMPPARNHHIAIDLSGGRMIVYGGRGDHFLDLKTDMWIYDVRANTWEKQTPLPDTSQPTFLGVPKPRIEAAAGKRSKDIIVIASGQGESKDLLADAWELNLVGATPVWKALPSMECKDGFQNFSETATMTSLGFFIVLGVTLFMLLRARNGMPAFPGAPRRADYDPL